MIIAKAFRIIATATATATTRAFLIALHLKEQFLRSDAEGTGAAEGNFRFCLLLL